MNRVTLRFSSEQGGEYLYDDVTGCILPWGPVEDAVLNQELGVPPTDPEREWIGKLSANEINAKTSFIRLWRTHYQAFARDEKIDCLTLTPEQLAQSVWANSAVLLLFLTEDCNLNCSYCCYSSGAYPLHRKPSHRAMTFEQAIKAIDWYVANKIAALERDPLKQLGLSFYGGEPLLNIGLIEQIMEYLEKRYPGLFFAVATSNGVLLSDKIADILVKHNVILAISLDGPEEEHDRLRVDHQGRGTHKRLIANLARLKNRYPDYWAKMLCVSVFDPKSDLIKIAKYFEDNEELLPRCAFVNQVTSQNSTYYQSFTEEDYTRFRVQLRSLRNSFKAVSTAGKEPSSYCQALAGGSIILAVLRSRLNDRKTVLPYTGCCLPGYRMAVNVDGRLDICERVSGQNPIGNVNQGGLDLVKIGRLVAEYQRNVLPQCSACPVSKLCSLCFSTAETSKGVERRSGWCEGTLATAARDLSDYISILEANGNVKAMFERNSLERRRAATMFQA